MARLEVESETDMHVRISYRGKTIGSFTRQLDGSVAAVIVPRFLAHRFWRDAKGEYHNIMGMEEK